MNCKICLMKDCDCLCSTCQDARERRRINQIECSHCGNKGNHKQYETKIYGIAHICSTCIVNSEVLYKRSLP